MHFSNERADILRQVPLSVHQYFRRTVAVICGVEGVV